MSQIIALVLERVEHIVGKGQNNDNSTQCLTDFPPGR